MISAPTTAIFEAQGVAMSPLVGLSRIRYDGYRLAWLNNEIYDPHQGLIPFVIEDETRREERVPKEHEHKNGVIGIDTITLATSDLDLARPIMSAVLGAEGEHVRDKCAQGLRREPYSRSDRIGWNI